MHVAPGHALQKTVLRQDPDVLRKIGVVNSARLQVQHLGREQRGQTNWPRRADDHFAESLPLDVIEHLQDRREAQLLKLVLWQFKFADRSKIFYRDLLHRPSLSRPEYD